MIVVRVQPLYGGAGGEPLNHDRIAEFIGSGNDEFDSGDEGDAEFFSERLNVFPDSLLQLVQWDRAESLVINFNRVRLLHE